MANTNAPFGFRRIGAAHAGTPNFQLTKRRIAYNNSGPIYFGDPVTWVSNTPTGYIKQATAAEFATNTYNNTLAGIFYGCEYISTAQKRKVWSNYWPGSDTAYDVIAYVCDDPDARFIVQADSTNYTLTSKSAWGTTLVGRPTTFNIGSGSTATGLSGAYLSGGATAATAGISPFLIMDYETSLGAPDPTSGYNWIVVGFLGEWLRANAASTAVS